MLHKIRFYSRSKKWVAVALATTTVFTASMVYQSVAQESEVPYRILDDRKSDPDTKAELVGDVSVGNVEIADSPIELQLSFGLTEEIVRNARRETRDDKDHSNDGATDTAESSAKLLKDQIREFKEAEREKDSERKSNAKEGIRKIIQKQFVDMEARRSKEIEALEKRLKSLKSVMKTRSENAELIVERRVQSLLGERNVLDWNAGEESNMTFQAKADITPADIQLLLVPEIQILSNELNESKIILSEISDDVSSALLDTTNIANSRSQAKAQVAEAAKKRAEADKLFLDAKNVFDAAERQRLEKSADLYREVELKAKDFLAVQEVALAEQAKMYRKKEDEMKKYQQKVKELEQQLSTWKHQLTLSADELKKLEKDRPMNAARQ